MYYIQRLQRVAHGKQFDENGFGPDGPTLDVRTDAATDEYQHRRRQTHLRTGRD